MAFLIEIFCFLLVFNYIATEPFDTVKKEDVLLIEEEDTSDYDEEGEPTKTPRPIGTLITVEFTFDAIPLGHSGLLVTWKPNITTQIEETLIKQKYFFKFETCIIEEKSNGNDKFDDNQNHNSVDKNNEDSESNYNKSDSFAGQYKIHSLKENTPYNVTIKQYLQKNSNTSLKEYSVEKRTNWKSQKQPAKPYFELEPVSDKKESAKRVRWYPCGKERICNDQESGTHFGVTIKEPYNTRKLSEVKIEEFSNDYVDIYFWPGIYYEMVVYSINGDSKTDSDSQETFVMPIFTQMQSVNIISLPDLSALISWKPPKHSLKGPLRVYSIFHFTFSEPDSYIVLYENNSKLIFSRTKVINAEYEQIRIFNLKREVPYIYIISPENDWGSGFQHRIEQKFQVFDQDLPIAKPDFNYKFVSYYDDECKFYFQWLPCGQSFNCENTKPGSNCTFHFKPEPPRKNYVQQYGYYEGTFDADVVYNVTLNSSIRNNFSESATKIFKNCKEIRENTPEAKEVKTEF